MEKPVANHSVTCLYLFFSFPNLLYLKYVEIQLKCHFLVLLRKPLALWMMVYKLFICIEG